MPNLRDIRNRITSVNNTQQITKAMKMVAAAKLRKAQNRMIENRPYASKMREVVGRLAEGDSSQAGQASPLLRVPEKVERMLLIVVGSDRGLCGGFNTNLFKMVEGEIRSTFSTHNEAGTLDLVCVGRKAVAYFKKRNYSVVREHAGFFDRLEYAEAVAIMQEAASQFTSGDYDAVYVAYNEFKSIISQNRRVQKLLPIDPADLAGAVAGAMAGGSSKSTPGSDSSTSVAKSVNADFIMEPDAATLLARLLPLYLNTQLWNAALESNASEQGARMAAMDNATENAKELERTLRLKYNQARQSAITTEISEIVSGAAALG